MELKPAGLALSPATRAQRIERIMTRILVNAMPPAYLPGMFHLSDLDRAFEMASTLVDYVDDKAKHFEDAAPLRVSNAPEGT